MKRLLVVTILFASHLVSAEEGLKWMRTPLIVKPTACGDVTLCVGSANGKDVAGLAVVCKTNLKNDCPDAQTCFDRKDKNFSVDLADTRIQYTALQDYKEPKPLPQYVPPAGRETQRGVGKSKSGLKPYVPGGAN